MSHVFQLPDEQYTKLVTYAAQQNQTPEALLQAWINEAIHNLEALTASHRTEQADQEGQAGREEELLNSPLFQVAGIFSIGEPGWADRHDEYLAEA